jgi:hypothetical protein
MSKIEAWTLMCRGSEAIIILKLSVKRACVNCSRRVHPKSEPRAAFCFSTAG